MQKHLKRLALALAISVASLVGTLAWYYAGLKAHRGVEGKDAVARLLESTDEVQRKEVSRVIWETVSLNDELFTGEAIRTGAKSSAKVRLTSGAIIHLDPDSLVVLEQNANGLALDFLEGNMFIQDNGATKSAITLKTGQGEITMNGADVTLSRGAKGEVDLEVHRGQLELNQGGNKTALGQDKAATLGAGGLRERRDQLRLTAPHAGDVVLLNFTKGEKLELTWTPLPVGYKVYVEVGGTRSSLNRRADIALDGAKGRGTLDLKPGAWLLRLRAEAAGQPELASLVTPLTVSPRQPPTLIEPTADAPVLRETPDQATTFRWLNRNAFDAQALEIASDETFRKVLRRENLGPDKTTAAIPLNDGSYFWRVTGFANKKALSSAVARVRIGAPLDQRAQLKSPAHRARIPAAVAAVGVALDWQGDPKRAYVVDLRPAAGGDAVVHREARGGHVVADALKPGAYRWTVTSNDTVSETFEFTVTEAPRLAFTTPAEVFEYVTDGPSLSLEWQSVPGATYRYRVSAADQSAEVAWTSSKLNKFNAPLAGDGAYRVEVEARDARNVVVAAAEPLVTQVRRRPLLAAPKWVGTNPKLSSDAAGNVTLTWDPLNGARGYVLELEDPRGRRVQRRFERGPASLKNMKPGLYQLKVKGVDEFKRAGEASPIRALDVPNTSDIRAPRIKAFKVK